MREYSYEGMSEAEYRELMSDWGPDPDACGACGRHTRDCDCGGGWW